MNREQIKAEFDRFIEYPAGSDRKFVTTVSTLLFAEHITKLAADAAQQIMTCDHIIGIGGGDPAGDEFLRASQHDEEAKRLRARFIIWADNPNALRQIIEQKRAYSDEEFIRDAYSLFNHCPNCGAKLRDDATI